MLENWSLSELSGGQSRLGWPDNTPSVVRRMVLSYAVLCCLSRPIQSCPVLSYAVLSCLSRPVCHVLFRPVCPVQKIEIKQISVWNYKKNIEKVLSHISVYIALLILLMRFSRSKQCCQVSIVINVIVMNEENSSIPNVSEVHRFIRIKIRIRIRIDSFYEDILKCRIRS